MVLITTLFVNKEAAIEQGCGPQIGFNALRAAQGSGQCLLEVRQQVLAVLDAYGEA